MALPTTTTAADIRKAAAEFDRNPARFHKPTKFAVVIDGRAYPPKAIISLATGVPVSGFSGGIESTRFLAKRGFETVALDESQPGD
jgi:5-methylcytosine-specific restriction protein A